MSRWKPDARGRLEQASFELFLERGYDKTTVADIAARAALTERTFFRHYADKREVFFGGSDVLRGELLRALSDVPPAAPAIEAVRIAVEAAARVLHGRRDLARERERIVSSNADLQERGLIKRATLTTALAEGLEQRGLPKHAAALAADIGMAVFHVGFAQWLDEPGSREFVDVVRDGFDRLKDVTAGT